jgi:hypothetical protein
MRDGATESVAAVAKLLRQRNEMDGEITRIINRPVVGGHLAAWLANELFDIDLEPAGSAKALGGRFTSGALATKTVNIQWIGERNGHLDSIASGQPDFCLVFTGPKALALTREGVVRAMRIDACYLFDARLLRARQLARGANGANGANDATASSVLAAEWEAAEIFPRHNNALLRVDSEAARLLGLFG